jgi:hypothetical protein
VDTRETLTWLRDNGVENLTDRTWLGQGQWFHGDPNCRKIGGDPGIGARQAELEELDGVQICVCVFESLAPSGSSNALLHASRIRIALETLETTLQAPELDEGGRYPNIRAAALQSISLEALQGIDEVIPELAVAAANCRRLWADAIDAHPLDWAAFDTEVLHRAAWRITTSVITKRLLANGLLESQADQVLFSRWKDLSARAGHVAAAETLTVDARTASLFEDWVRTFENNLVDDEPRTCYVGSISTRMRPGQTDPRTLVVARGIRTPLTAHGFADSGFAIFPNVVARVLKLDQEESRSGTWGTTPVCGGHVSLLTFGLPDLTEEQWQIAISLWRESFEYVEDEPLYRDFANAIIAAAGL